MALADPSEIAGPFQPNVAARLIDNRSVLTVINGREGTRGPWSLLAGIPGDRGDLLGPPPGFLSVAAWAA